MAKDLDFTIKAAPAFRKSSREEEALQHLIDAWNSKNAKAAKRVGTFGFMAAALTACGGSGSITSDTSQEELSTFRLLSGDPSNLVTQGLNVTLGSAKDDLLSITDLIGSADAAINATAGLVVPSGQTYIGDISLFDTGSGGISASGDGSLWLLAPASGFDANTDEQIVKLDVDLNGGTLTFDLESDDLTVRIDDQSSVDLNGGTLRISDGDVAVSAATYASWNVGNLIVNSRLVIDLRKTKLSDEEIGKVLTELDAATDAGNTESSLRLLIDDVEQTELVFNALQANTGLNSDTAPKVEVENTAGDISIVDLEALIDSKIAFMAKSLERKIDALEVSLSGFTRDSEGDLVIGADDYATLKALSDAINDLQALAGLDELGASGQNAQTLVARLNALETTTSTAIQTYVSEQLDLLEVSLSGFTRDSEGDLVIGADDYATLKALSDAINDLQALAGLDELAANGQDAQTLVARLSDAETKLSGIASTVTAEISSAVNGLQQQIEGEGFDTATLKTLADLSAAIETLRGDDLTEGSIEFIISEVLGDAPTFDSTTGRFVPKNLGGGDQTVGDGLALLMNEALNYTDTAIDDLELQVAGDILELDTGVTLQTLVDLSNALAALETTASGAGGDLSALQAVVGAPASTDGEGNTIEASGLYGRIDTAVSTAVTGLEGQITDLESKITGGTITQTDYDTLFEISNALATLTGAADGSVSKSISDAIGAPSTETSAAKGLFIQVESLIATAVTDLQGKIDAINGEGDLVANLSTLVELGKAVKGLQDVTSGEGGVTDTLAGLQSQITSIIDTNIAGLQAQIDAIEDNTNGENAATLDSIAGLKAAVEALQSASLGEGGINDALANLQQSLAGLDITPPTVVDITLTASGGDSQGVLNAGDIVTATVAFTEAVLVTGSPTLQLDVGGQIVEAAYAGGAGTEKLSFTYTITASDSDVDGISVPENALQVSGDTTILDSAGNAANLMSGAAADTSMTVDNSPLALSMSAGTLFGASSVSYANTAFGVSESLGGGFDLVYLSELDGNGSYTVAAGLHFSLLDNYFSEDAFFDNLVTGPATILFDLSGKLVVTGLDEGISAVYSEDALRSYLAEAPWALEGLSVDEYIAQNTVPAETISQYDGFSAGETIADGVLAQISGHDPADVSLTVTSPLTVAQANALLEYGFAVENMTYSIRDYDTTVQGALVNPATADILRGAEQVTAIGDELDNEAMRFTSFDQRVNLRIEGLEGDDQIDAGRGDDEIVGGLGTDVIELTYRDNSDDAVVYQTIYDGETLPITALTFSDNADDYREGSVLTVQVNGTAYQYTTVDGDTIATALQGFATAIEAAADVGGVVVKENVLEIFGATSSTKLTVVTDSGSEDTIFDIFNEGLATKWTVSFSSDAADWPTQTNSGNTTIFERELSVTIDGDTIRADVAYDENGDVDTAQSVQNLVDAINEGGTAAEVRLAVSNGDLSYTSVTATGTVTVNGITYDLPETASSLADLAAAINDEFGQRTFARTSEIVVNTFTKGNQDEPDITALSDGGFLVTYYGASQDPLADFTEEDNDDSFFEREVWAQRFDADGNKVGGEFQINARVEDDQDTPSVTQLANGNLVFVWESDDGDSTTPPEGAASDSPGDGDGEATVARIFDMSTDTPTPLGDEFVVNQTTASNQDDPHVAALSNGGFVVVWEDSVADGDGNGVFARVFDASGSETVAEYQVNTTTTGEQSEPKVVGYNGGFIVAWEAGDFANGDHIAIQNYDNNGARIGSETNIVTGGFPYEIEMATLPNGKVAISWTAESEVVSRAGARDAFFTIFDPDAPDAALVVTNAMVGQEDMFGTVDTGEPSVSALSDGGFVVVFEDQSDSVGGTGNDVWARQFNADGTPRADAFQLNTTTDGDQDSPVSAGLLDGGFAVSWEGPGTPNEVFARVYNGPVTRAADLVASASIDPETGELVIKTSARGADQSITFDGEITLLDGAADIGGVAQTTETAAGTETDNYTAVVSSSGQTVIEITGAAVPATDTDAPTFTVDSAAVDQNGTQQQTTVAFSSNDADYYEGGTLSVEISGVTVTANMVAGDAAASVTALKTAIEAANVQGLESVEQSVGTISEVEQAIVVSGLNPATHSYQLDLRSPFYVLDTSMVWGDGTVNYRIDSSLERLAGSYDNDGTVTDVVPLNTYGYVYFENVDDFIASLKSSGSPSGVPITTTYDIGYDSVTGLLTVAQKAGGSVFSSRTYEFQIGRAEPGTDLTLTAASEAPDPLSATGEQTYEGEYQQATISLEDATTYGVSSDGTDIPTDREPDVYYEGGKVYATITGSGDDVIFDTPDDTVVTVSADMQDAATSQALVDAINDRITGVEGQDTPATPAVVTIEGDFESFTGVAPFVGSGVSEVRLTYNDTEYAFTFSVSVKSDLIGYMPSVGPIFGPVSTMYISDSQAVSTSLPGYSVTTLLQYISRLDFIASAEIDENKDIVITSAGTGSATSLSVTIDGNNSAFVTALTDAAEDQSDPGKVTKSATGADAVSVPGIPAELADVLESAVLGENGEITLTAKNPGKQTFEVSDVRLDYQGVKQIATISLEDAVRYDVRADGIDVPADREASVYFSDGKVYATITESAADIAGDLNIVESVTVSADMVSGDPNPASVTVTGFAQFADAKSFEIDVNLSGQDYAISADNLPDGYELTAIVYFDSTYGTSTTASNNLANQLEAAGYTVTRQNFNAPDLPTDEQLAEYTQVWTVVGNTGSAWPSGLMTQLEEYVKGGGSLFFMSENQFFNGYNAQAQDVIRSLGGGDTFTISETVVNGELTVASEIRKATDLQTFTNMKAAAQITDVGNGTPILSSALNNQAHVGVLFSAGDLTNAPNGTVVLVSDVNFLDDAKSTGTSTQAIESVALTDNLIATLEEAALNFPLLTPNDVLAVLRTELDGVATLELSGDDLVITTVARGPDASLDVIGAAISDAWVIESEPDVALSDVGDYVGFSQTLQNLVDAINEQINGVEGTPAVVTLDANLAPGATLDKFASGSIAFGFKTSADESGFNWYQFSVRNPTGSSYYVMNLTGAELVGGKKYADEVTYDGFINYLNTIDGTGVDDRFSAEINAEGDIVFTSTATGSDAYLEVALRYAYDGGFNGDSTVLDFGTFVDTVDVSGHPVIDLVGSTQSADRMLSGLSDTGDGDASTAADPGLSALLESAAIGENGEITLTAKNPGKQTFEVSDVRLDYQGLKQIAEVDFSALSDGQPIVYNADPGSELTVTVQETLNDGTPTGEAITISAAMADGDTDADDDPDQEGSLAALVDAIQAEIDGGPGVATAARVELPEVFDGSEDLVRAGSGFGSFRMDLFIETSPTESTTIALSADFYSISGGYGYWQLWDPLSNGSPNVYKFYEYFSVSGLTAQGFVDAFKGWSKLENAGLKLSYESGKIVVESIDTGSDVTVGVKVALDELDNVTAANENDAGDFFTGTGSDGSATPGQLSGIVGSVSEANGVITLTSADNVTQQFTVTAASATDPAKPEITTVAFSTDDADYFTAGSDEAGTAGRVSVTVAGSTYVVAMRDNASDTLNALLDAIQNGQNGESEPHPDGTVVAALTDVTVELDEPTSTFTFTGQTNGTALTISGSASADAVKQVTDIAFDTGFDDDNTDDVDFIGGIGRDVSVTIAGETFTIDGETRLELLQDLKTQLESAIAADTGEAGIAAKLQATGIVLDEGDESTAPKLTLTARYGGTDPLNVSTLTRAGLDPNAEGNVAQEIQIGFTTTYLNSLVGTAKSVTVELGQASVTYEVQGGDTAQSIVTAIATALEADTLVGSATVVDGRFIDIVAATPGPNVLGTVASGAENTVSLFEGAGDTRVEITAGFFADETVVGEIDLDDASPETVGSATSATAGAEVALADATKATTTPTQTAKSEATEEAVSITNAGTGENDDSSFFGDAALNAALEPVSGLLKITPFPFTKTLELSAPPNTTDASKGRHQIDIRIDGISYYTMNDYTIEPATLGDLIDDLNETFRNVAEFELVQTGDVNFPTELQVTTLSTSVFSSATGNPLFVYKSNPTGATDGGIVYQSIAYPSYEIGQGSFGGGLTGEGVKQTFTNPDTSYTATDSSPVLNSEGDGTGDATYAGDDASIGAIDGEGNFNGQGVKQTFTNPGDGYTGIDASPQEDTNDAGTGNDALFGSDPGVYDDGGLLTTYMNGEDPTTMDVDGEGTNRYTSDGVRDLDLTNIIDVDATVSTGAASTTSDLGEGDLVNDRTGFAGFEWDAGSTAVLSLGNDAPDVIYNFQTGEGADVVSLEEGLATSTQSGLIIGLSSDVVVESTSRTENFNPTFGPEVGPQFLGWRYEELTWDLSAVDGQFTVVSNPIVWLRDNNNGGEQFAQGTSVGVLDQSFTSVAELGQAYENYIDGLGKGDIVTATVTNGELNLKLVSGFQFNSAMYNPAISVRFDEVNVVKQNFDLSEQEFAVIDSSDSLLNSSEISDSSQVAGRLNEILDFSGTSGDSGLINTTIFAVTASDDDSVTAIWAHQQSSSTDSTVEALELYHLATVNTIGGEFELSNFGDVLAVQVPV